MNVFINKHGDVFQSSGCCPTTSEAQKSKFGEYRVRIDERCVLVEKTCFLFVNIKVLTYVKLNSGLSPDFSVQLNVSLSKRLSRRLSQKLKSPSE